MVASKNLFPASLMNRQDVALPASPGYVLGWTFMADGVSDGRLILGVDNRLDGEYGREDVRVYIDVELAPSIPIRVELYTLAPLVPTYVVPAGEILTVEVASFLAGRGLDFSHCTGLGVSLESAGGETKTKAHFFASFNGALEWRGEII